MNASPTARHSEADRTAARLGRIVLIGAALLEAVVMVIAFFSHSGPAIK